MNRSRSHVRPPLDEGADDAALPFHIPAAGVRGRAVRLNSSLTDIMGRNSYPSWRVESAVAECAVLAALIGPMIHPKWKLSLQVRGDGPLRLVTADYLAPESSGMPAKIRAYGSVDRDRTENSSMGLSSIFGNGYLGLLIDTGGGKQPYQGLTPLRPGGLSECAEEYFFQSEQIPTKISIAVSAGGSSHPEQFRAGGIIIQQMPRPSKRAGKEAIAGIDGPGASWFQLCDNLDAVEGDHLHSREVTPLRVLQWLFFEEDIVAGDRQAIEFGCSCSPAKVRQGLSIYSAKDIATMTTAEGVVTADCQFCGEHYEFDPETLGFEANRKPSDAAG